MGLWPVKNITINPRFSSYSGAGASWTNYRNTRTEYVCPSCTYSLPMKYVDISGTSLPSVFVFTHSVRFWVFFSALTQLTVSVSQLEFIISFQHKYGYIRDERSQFIEDTVEPSVFLPGIISLVIMCIGIIWNNSFFSRRTRSGRGWNRSSATANVTLYCTWRPSGLTIGLHGQGSWLDDKQSIWPTYNLCYFCPNTVFHTSEGRDRGRSN